MAVFGEDWRKYNKKDIKMNRIEFIKYYLVL